MRKNEIIVLDATLKNVIGDCAFMAELENGHAIVAHARGADRAQIVALKVGDSVQVELSPFDMSKGRIKLDSLRKII